MKKTLGKITVSMKRVSELRLNAERRISGVLLFKIMERKAASLILA
jgi:hypothetical protein